MSDRAMRSWLRWTHVILGLLLVGYLYTPLHADEFATDVARFLLVPIMMVTGLAMWQQLGLARFSDKG
jgi:thiosulfate reductase cytochrome b subunit